MAEKTIRQALHEALVHEMRGDPRVVVIGEDVSGGAGTLGGRDAAGGEHRCKCHGQPQPPAKKAAQEPPSQGALPIFSLFLLSHARTPAASR